MLQIFHAITTAIALIHIGIFFALLYEPSTGRRATALISALTCSLVIFLNVFLYLRFNDNNIVTNFIPLTLFIPCFTVFFIIAKYRDGRYFFTCSLVITIVLCITILSAIIDKLLFFNKGIFFLSFVALVLPILEILVFKKARKSYFALRESLIRAGAYLP